MGQRESRLSRRIIQRLQQEFGLRIFCFKVWGNEHQQAGLPDILGCIEGRFFGLETKLPESRENVSMRQELTHTMIRQGGGFVRVVTSTDEAVEALYDLLRQIS
jgi:hypothetical protein